ncbi:MAG: sensor histidine kinase, partial [Eubacteriales bacterium]|nr:sensor histidine kinase [Eubacteriales bacterium]
ALTHGVERFYMDDTRRSSKTHFGIGLYTVNAIIQRHGGQLILGNSTETGGGEVTIKIPCEMEK